MNKFAIVADSSCDINSELKQKYDLEYTACLNSEPMFEKYPGDAQAEREFHFLESRVLN